MHYKVTKCHMLGSELCSVKKNNILAETLRKEAFVWCLKRLQLGGLPLAVNPPFKRMKNLHLNTNISLCCQHYQLLFPMNVLKAEKPYCNLFENFIFNVFSFTLSFILCAVGQPCSISVSVVMILHSLSATRREMTQSWHSLMYQPLEAL